jgi:UDP-N-acetylglucosamine transferase subunit ALG13
VIFVTVGSMFPFDRLIRLMDAWASEHPDVEVIAQIGDGKYVPVTMRWERTIGKKEFSKNIRDAEIVVAHAGIGTIVQTLEAGKPVVVLPRQATLGEHTTDHQLHTVKWLGERPGVFVAMTDEALPVTIAQLQERRTEVNSTLGPTAPAAFIARLREFLIA